MRSRRSARRTRSQEAGVIAPGPSGAFNGTTATCPKVSPAAVCGTPPQAGHECGCHPGLLPGPGHRPEPHVPACHVASRPRRTRPPPSPTRSAGAHTGHTSRCAFAQAEQPRDDRHGGPGQTGSQQQRWIGRRR
jgi:hypothetical protein